MAVQCWLCSVTGQFRVRGAVINKIEPKKKDFFPSSLSPSLPFGNWPLTHLVISRLGRYGLVVGMDTGARRANTQFLTRTSGFECWKFVLAVEAKYQYRRNPQRTRSPRARAGSYADACSGGPRSRDFDGRRLAIGSTVYFHLH